MKNRKHWWIWLVVALYIYFIFRNSMQIAAASDEMSFSVARRLLSFINRKGFWIDIYLFNHYVRKLAHFCEFAGLGFLVTGAMKICPLFKSRFLNFSLFLFLIPIMDETIQKFVEGRSSQVFDMLIDGGGFLFGGFCCYVLILIIQDIFLRKN